MSLFQRKKSASHLMSEGHFELERDGHIATLQYTLANNVLTLIETEVPAEMRGQGVAGKLAKNALDYAREHQMKVDVLCPFVAGYLRSHPEYADLVIR